MNHRNGMNICLFLYNSITNSGWKSTVIFPVHVDYNFVLCVSEKKATKAIGQILQCMNRVGLCDCVLATVIRITFLAFFRTWSFFPTENSRWMNEFYRTTTIVVRIIESGEKEYRRRIFIEITSPVEYMNTWQFNSHVFKKEISFSIACSSLLIFTGKNICEVLDFT